MSNTLVIDIINKCNLACPYCFGPINNEDFLSVGEVVDIVKKTDKNYIVITGGEPLLHKNLIIIIKSVYDLGKKVILHTNGILLSQDFLDKTKNYIYRVNLPIDSIDFDINAKLRGKIHLKKALRAIDLVKNNGLKLSISSVFTKVNEDYFLELAEYLEKISPDLWRVFEFIPQKAGPHGSEDHDKELIPSKNKIKTFKEELKKYNFNRLEFIDSNSDFYTG